MKVVNVGNGVVGRAVGTFVGAAVAGTTGTTGGLGAGRLICTPGVGSL